MKIEIQNQYKKEIIVFLYETDVKFNNWTMKNDTDKFSCELTKNISKNDVDYFLVCGAITLDGFPCYGEDGYGQYKNDMSDTPTGIKIIEEMQKYFTI
jgi:hypothetical protein